MGLNKVLTEKRKGVSVVVELGELNQYFDPGLRSEGARQAVPKVFHPKAAIRVRQHRVKNELQGEQQVRLADLVLADDNGVFADLEVQVAEVSEVLDLDACDPHTGCSAAWAG